MKARLTLKIRAGARNTEILIVSGLTGTTEIVEIAGMDSDSLDRAILESHGHRSNSGSAATREG